MQADDLDKALIDVLTRRRVATGMTQEDLAAAVTDLKIGVVWTRTHVAAIEAGRRKGLRMGEVIALCIVHDVTLAEMLLEAGVEERHVAVLQRRAVDQIVMEQDLDQLQRRVDVARTALDPDEPLP